MSWLNWKVLMRVSPFIIILLLVAPLLCSCETGVYHTVTKGQTLYRISRTYQVNERYLARVNGISDPSQIRIGTRLFIPGANQVKSVSVVRPPAPASVPAGNKASTSVKKPVSVSVPPTVVAKPKTTSPAPAKPRAKTKAKPVNVAADHKLNWPLRGKITRTFSQKSRTGGGKGVEIAVRAGSTVSAADAGKVIYSGDGVRGYGYLIILQHENDLFTVYGFNNKNFVKQGDFVSKGERIALSGTPPGGGAARLHFEVRKGKVAVDPLLFLP